jgi:hypothetical protein
MGRYMIIVLIIGVLFLAAWSVGMATRFTLGGLVHIALVLSVILIIFWLLRAIFRIL